MDPQFDPLYMAIGTAVLVGLPLLLVMACAPLFQITGQDDEA
jgi:hypothetical protein